MNFSEPTGLHQPTKLTLRVAPVVHHQRVFQSRIAIETPVGVIGRNVRNVKQLDDLFETRTLKGQLSAGLQYANPFTNHLRGIPHLKMLDDVNRPCGVCVVVWERKRLQVSRHIRIKGCPFLRNPALGRALLAVYRKVNADPAVFLLVSAAKIEPYRSAH